MNNLLVHGSFGPSLLSEFPNKVIFSQCFLRMQIGLSLRDFELFYSESATSDMDQNFQDQHN